MYAKKPTHLQAIKMSGASKMPRVFIFLTYRILCSTRWRHRGIMELEEMTAEVLQLPKKEQIISFLESGPPALCPQPQLEGNKK